MRRIPAALLISLGLHAGLVAGALVFLQRDRGVADAPDKQVMVELVLEERRGEARPPAPPQPPAPPLTAETPAVEPRMATPPVETKSMVDMAREAMAPPPAIQAREENATETTVPPPVVEAALPDKTALAVPEPVPETAPAVAIPELPSPDKTAVMLPVPKPLPAGETAAGLLAGEKLVPEGSTTSLPRAPSPRETATIPPPPEPIQPEKAQKQDKAIPPASSPEPAAPPPAMTITLSGTDSPSNALAQGEQIIPAAADAVFHNRQPLYPLEALRRGQHGAVVVVIHVAPSGRAAGADVVSSSGHMLLDRAAREAVLTWRFLPAMKGGRAVASDLPMRFIFEEE